jgi:hypothetical protein
MHAVLSEENANISGRKSIEATSLGALQHASHMLEMGQMACSAIASNKSNAACLVVAPTASTKEKSAFKDDSGCTVAAQVPIEGFIQCNYVRFITHLSIRTGDHGLLASHCLSIPSLHGKEPQNECGAYLKDDTAHAML